MPARIWLTYAGVTPIMSASFRWLPTISHAVLSASMPENIAMLNATVNSTDIFSAAYYRRMTRREVLIRLIKERFGGNQAEFARAIRKSPAQVNQWVSGHRNLGDAGARHIEITLGLPQGYFDSAKRIDSNKVSDDLGKYQFEIVKTLSPGKRKLMEVIRECMEDLTDEQAKSLSMLIKSIRGNK